MTMDADLDDLLVRTQQRADAARLEAAMLREDLRKQRARINQATENLRKQNASLRMSLAQARTTVEASKRSRRQQTKLSLFG
jgi:hypothetical protein